MVELRKECKINGKNNSEVKTKLKGMRKQLNTIVNALPKTEGEKRKFFKNQKHDMSKTGKEDPTQR